VPAISRQVAGDIAVGDAPRRRIVALNAVFPRGRALTRSLAAISGTRELAGRCGRAMLSATLPVTGTAIEAMRAPLQEMRIT
jgi:hypothetical protein